ncbi:unnamed protein product [Nezara viridula]|uniref:Uncharacterized protein n=1 Tax=Nezara viridula TaxID=85310 RepID=A0A9P0MT86_NEZVI|nr:unnamed protein product [Nezara viridula]
MQARLYQDNQPSNVVLVLVLQQIGGVGLFGRFWATLEKTWSTD